MAHHRTFRFFCAILYDQRDPTEEAYRFAVSLSDRIKQKYPARALPVKIRWDCGSQSMTEVVNSLLWEAKYFVVIYSKGFMEDPWKNILEKRLKAKEHRAHDLAFGIQGFKSFPSYLTTRQPPVFGTGRSENGTWDSILNDLRVEEGDVFSEVQHCQTGIVTAPERKWSNILVRNMEQLVNSLFDVKSIADSLISKLILPSDFHDDLEHEKTRKDQARLLVKIMKDKSETEIEDFVNCIKRNYKFVYEDLTRQAQNWRPSQTAQVQGPAGDGFPHQEDTQVTPEKKFTIVSQVSQEAEEDAKLVSCLSEVSLEEAATPPPCTGISPEEAPTGQFAVQVQDESMQQDMPDEVDGRVVMHASPDQTEVKSTQSDGARILIPSEFETNQSVPLYKNNIFIDLITVVRDEPTIQLDTVRFFYTDDNTGPHLFKDILCDFVEAWLNQYSEGMSEKIPVTVTDLEEEDYPMIGNILRQGYEKFRYFPQQLCIVSLIDAIHGKDKVTPDMLKASFYNYVKEKEAELIKKVLANKQMSEDESKKLNSIFSRFKSKKELRADTLEDIISRCAKNRLITLARHVLVSMEMSKWKDYEDFQSPEAILSFMKSLKPKAEDVAAILQTDKNSPEPSMEEQNAFNDLKRYVENLPDDILKKFLRFTTGSDVLCQKNMTVTVHFHVPKDKSNWFKYKDSLWIPVNYTTCNELESEFTNFLNQNK